MKKIDELLAVLDMLGSDQFKAMAKLAWHHRKDSQIWADYHQEYKGGYMETTFADLAFRLRDEWSKFGAFYSAMLDVQEYLKIEKYTSRRAMSYKFWAIQAQPIHWIIAALIAKELARKERTDGN